MEGGNFLLATRQGRKSLPAVAINAGQQVTFELPQTGFGAALNLLLQGSVATADGDSFTAKAYPAFPAAVVARIRVYSNEGVELYNTSGWGNIVYQTTLRTGVSPLDASLFSLTTEGFAINFRVPITWGENLQAGLILLQNTNVRYYCEITFSTVLQMNADGDEGTLTGTITPSLEFYHLPSRQQDYPLMKYLKQVVEDIKVIPGTGDFVYQPPTGNLYTRVLQEFVNKASGAFVPMTVKSDLTRLQLNYSQTQVPYDELVLNRLADQERWYGQALPAGVVAHELSLGNGFPEVPTSRDIINTSRLTDFNIVTGIGSSVTVDAAAYCRTIREQLLPIRVG